MKLARRILNLCLAALGCLGFSLPAPAAAGQAGAAPIRVSAFYPLEAQPFAGDRLLVDADAAATLAVLGRGGAALLADYGAFSLWRAPDAQAGALAALPGASPAQDYDLIYLRGGAIDTRLGAPPAPLGLAQDRQSGEQFWLVQFVGPVKDDWLADLRGLGLEIVAYLPVNAYVVWGDGAALARLDALAAASAVIQWSGAYHPAYRLEPSLQAAAADSPPGGPVSVTVQLYTTKDTPASLAALLALGGPVRRGPERILNFTNISLDLPAGQLALVAGWPDVFNVEPWAPPALMDEVQGQIVAGNVISSAGKIVPSGPGYLAWLASKGFPETPGSYPVVDVVDDGLDQGDAAAVLHPDFHELGLIGNPDRVLYIADCTADPSGDGVGGHGNLNAGIVAAYNNLAGSPHQDALGYSRDLGISPYGRVAATKIFRNNGAPDVSQCGGTDSGVVLSSYNLGADLTSNSWGYWLSSGVYNSASQAYDALTRDASAAEPGNQEMLHIFAAGNDGPGLNTVTAPGTAKNVLTVGATENVRDNGIFDGCGYSASDNADDLASFSGRGPADDGRVKPDLMAPGIHVQGPASQDAEFSGASVCGAQGNDGVFPGGDAMYPTGGQTLYTWSSGTSHSTPALAGAAALAYEYYGRVLAAGQTPSPAMLKALLVNSSRYLAGLSAGDTLPSQAQGWGDADLGRLFDGAPRALLDQTTVFTATGDEYSVAGTIANPAQPFRVTLVWTDAPGATTGAAYVNDLDLEVVAGGVTYLGNVFDGADSIAGGVADPRNNVENVFLPAGVGGSFVVRVIARNIAGDGLPGDADPTDQDFALAIYNGEAAPVAVLADAGMAWDDSAGNGDGVIDPGETIGLTLDLENIGTAAALEVSGQVSLTDGAAALDNTASGYPDIAAGGTASNADLYTFTVGLAQDCGEPLGLQHDVAYADLQSMAYLVSLPVGDFTDPGPVVNYAYPGGPVAIPDNNPAGATVSVIAPDGGWVGDVDVHFSAAHTWDEDLDIYLISPLGTVVELSTDNGGFGDHYTGTVFDDEAATPITNGSAPFAGYYRPEGALSALGGEPVGGTWTLKAVDDEAGFIGSITEFSLDLRSAGVVCHPVAPFVYYLPIFFR